VAGARVLFAYLRGGGCCEVTRSSASADHTEHHNQVVQAIRQYMEWSKAWNLKVAGGMFQRKGIPDILACWPPKGRLVAVEVKTGKGLLTPEQRDEMTALARAGAVVVLASSVDDLEEVLIKQEIISAPLVVSPQQALRWRLQAATALRAPVDPLE
jgi:VRR-NUC domain